MLPLSQGRKTWEGTQMSRSCPQFYHHPERLKTQSQVSSHYNVQFQGSSIPSPRKGFSLRLPPPPPSTPLEIPIKLHTMYLSLNFLALQKPSPPRKFQYPLWGEYTLWTISGTAQYMYMYFKKQYIWVIDLA